MQYEDIKSINSHTGDDYVACDAMSYIIFRTIEHIVSTYSEYEIKYPLMILSHVDAPHILIETLLKYIPQYSKFHSDDFRNQFKIDKPIDYVSLFEEDV